MAAHFTVADAPGRDRTSVTALSERCSAIELPAPVRVHLRPSHRHSVLSFEEEGEGFEPSSLLSPGSALALRRLQPLSQPSICARRCHRTSSAEGGGLEPPRPLGPRPFSRRVPYQLG